MSRIVIVTRRTGYAGHIACMQEQMIACKVFMGKLAGKKPLESNRLRWEGNIKMCLREIGWDVMGCTNLAPDTDQWSGLIRMIIKFCFHQMLGHS
jgi:hypothetical protein